MSGNEIQDKMKVAEKRIERLRERVAEIEATCDHDWQEQPGEPPFDVCSNCGAVRE
jgi:hypothetical protein